MDEKRRDEHIKALKNEMNQAKTILDRLKTRRKVFTLLCCLFFLLALLTIIATIRTEVFRPFFLITFAFSSLFASTLLSLLLTLIPLAFFRTQERRLRLEEELELAEWTGGDMELRAEKLFNNHRRELKRYYDINLGHYRAMFPIGVIAIVVGTIIIAVSLFVLRDGDATPMIVGTISGVLVNFVGAVLIRMYTETVKSSIAFHRQLSKSNQAFFANMLTYKIEDKNLRDQTFAELAKLVVVANDEQDISET
ncbi:MAG: hypothetical protein FWE40_03140 [Oscillospiraceae bacterium]|nr:hypothetical protein [Oscillospiraceae bacterium]